MLSYTLSKTADRMILRPVSQDSRGSVSTGETPRQKMSKVVASRDTKLDSGRELTNSNLFLFESSSEKEFRRLYRLKLDNHRISLDRKSGQAFLDHETFTKGHRLDFQSRKTGDRSILCVKTPDSPQNSSNWREPSRRKGVGIFFSRRGSACQAFYVPSTSFWTSVSLESASIPNGVVWNFDLPSSTTVSSIPLSRRRVMYFSAATKLMFDR